MRALVLDGLFVTPAVTAIGEALSSTSADGKLAVVGNAKLAQALTEAKREVLPIAMSARAAKKLTNALADLSSIEDRSLAAVIGVDIANDACPFLQRDLPAVVARDGGTIVFVDRGHAPEASRRALCAGLSEIEQRHAGRMIVTSGLVTHLL